MSTPSLAPPDHPQGEHAEVDPGREDAPVAALTFGGRVHVEWDPQAPVTPLGQLPFFIEYLRLGGLFEPWVADCPLAYTSPNAPKVRDVLGTVLLAVLAGHRRYAHITGLRADGVNPGLLGMGKVVSLAPGLDPGGGCGAPGRWRGSTRWRGSPGWSGISTTASDRS
jgi:hypothetical protein